MEGGGFAVGDRQGSGDRDAGNDPRRGFAGDRSRGSALERSRVGAAADRRALNRTGSYPPGIAPTRVASDEGCKSKPPRSLFARALIDRPGTAGGPLVDIRVFRPK